jgi:hypothetical protein
MSPDDVLQHCFALDLTRTTYLFNPPAADPNNPNPSQFDCSELVRWACRRAGITPEMPDGSWFQHIHCKTNGTMISLATGFATKGALLIKSRDAFGRPIEPIPAVAPAQAHIAFSLGDGRTYEAMGPGPDRIGFSTSTNRTFTHAALIPGVTYGATPPAPPPPPLSLPGNASPRWNRPTLRFGTSGLNVFFAQDLLIKMGAPELKTLGITGAYYAVTQRAMIAFQQRVRNQYVASFAVDGICGPYTWGWLLYLSGRGTE